MSLLQQPRVGAPTVHTRVLKHAMYEVYFDEEDARFTQAELDRLSAAAVIAAARHMLREQSAITAQHHPKPQP